MARKSSIKRLPAEVRKHLEKALREDKFTLDELIADLQQHFPGEETPSRSALHRYRVNLEEMMGRMREIETASAVLVGELGEGVGDKAGALLAQAVTTLATNAAFKAHDQIDDISITEIGKLARAAKAALETRTLSLKERTAVEKAAREKLLREQEERLQEAGRAQGLNADQVQFWRKEVLGVG